MNPLVARLLQRRSCRNFTFDQVSDDDVHDLLKAAMSAPSAGCSDPWHFVVVRNPGMLVSLAGVLPRGSFLADAGMGIVVCGDKERAHGRQEAYLVMDCSAAMENLLLAATFLGLGSCWLGVHPRRDRVAAVRQLLALPQTILPVGIAAIGTVVGDRPRPRTRFRDSAVHFEQW
ncbi:MAG: nitroreductase family protein [Kiritimatiellia bacterium]|jgi:nitroreductase